MGQIVIPKFIAFIVNAFIAAFTKNAIFRFVVVTLFTTGINMALRKKPRLGSLDQGQKLQLSLNPSETRKIIVGKTAVGGSLVYWNVYGSENENLELVIALSDYQTTSLETMVANGKTAGISGQPLSHTGSGAVPSFNLPDASTGMTITYYDGRESQTADAGLVTNGPWTSDHKGVGVSYIVAELVYDPVTYERGIPAMQFVVKGAPIFSNRDGDTYLTKSTHSYSANGPDILRHFLRGFRTDGGDKIAGPGIDADGIDDATFDAAANDADSSISIVGPPSGSEAKYECHGVIDTGDTYEETVRNLLSSFAGDLPDRGGVYHCLSGASQTPALTVTDEDIISDTAFTRQPKRSRDELVNTVKARFVDPSSQYLEGEIVPRVDSTAVTEDGGERKTELLDFPFVTSETQAQRLAEIFLRRSRYQRIITFTGRARLIQLEAGDWFTADIERYGWTGGSTKVFEVLSTTLNLQNMTVTISAQEIASTVFAWTPGTDEADAAASDAVTNPSSTTLSVSGLTVTSAAVTSGSQQVPEIRVQFTPPDDGRVIAIEVAYRIGSSGTEVVKTYPPDASDVRFRDGIFSGVGYEVRVRPVAIVGSTSWTSWTAVTAASAPITTPMLADDAVTTAKVAANAVTNTSAGGSTPSYTVGGGETNSADLTLHSETLTLVSGSEVDIRINCDRSSGYDAGDDPVLRVSRDQTSFEVDVWLRVLRGSTEIWTQKIYGNLGALAEFIDLEAIEGLNRVIEDSGFAAGSTTYSLRLTCYRAGTTTAEASDIAIERLVFQMQVVENRDR